MPPEELTSIRQQAQECLHRYSQETSKNKMSSQSASEQVPERISDRLCSQSILKTIIRVQPPNLAQARFGEYLNSIWVEYHNYLRKLNS